MEIKRRLPEEGVKWLFTRCWATQIKQGSMDTECTMTDEQGYIFAVVHHIRTTRYQG